jgi:ferritin-like metal-binding protein YciE
MSVNNPKEFFVLMLTDVLQSTKIMKKLFEEFSKMTQDPNVKEALEARVFVSDKVHETLQQCFRLIGEHPQKTGGRLYDIFADDFRRELDEIQNPIARHLFILARANHLIHLRISEYKTLIAAADLSGHFGVGVLLESCLADNIAFVERTRRLIENIAATKMVEKIAARSVA